MSTLETPRGQLTVRPVVESDLALYRDLRLEALRLSATAFPDDYEEALERPGAVWLERLRRHVNGGHAAVIVAVGPGGFAAMAGIHRDHGVKVRHNATVWGVYVRPAWREQRVATALLAEVVAWARRQDVTRLEARVEAVGDAARRLFAAAGFEQAGVLHGTARVNGRALDAVLLECRLA